MAYSGSGRVNIVSLASGETLLVENDSQAYTLSEPSIVTLQGAPSQVSAWQRQGSDLILHQDGGVSRFQQFFSTDPQSQSQLIFQDGATQQQALFANEADEAETTVTLTPTLAAVPAAVETVDSTLIVNNMAVPVDSVAAAVTTTPTTPTPTPTPGTGAVTAEASTTLPTLTINPVSGDDAVNYKEGVYGVEITGTSTQLASGTRVELTLDGKTWSGYVNNNVWSVQVGDSDLAAIKDGSYTFSVSATDASGNSVSATRDLLLISHYNSSIPLVTTDELTLADVTYQNGEPIYTVTGTMQTPFPLTMFAVKGEIESYRTGTLNADGSWSVQLTSQDIHTQHGQNALVLGVQDGAGNWFEQQIYVTTDLETPVGTGGGGAEVPVPVPPVENPTDGTPPDNPDTTPPETGGGATATPKPTIAVPFGDGWLNHDEKTHSETLSGTTGVTGSGQQVAINISGSRYQATVADDGKWSLALTSAQLMGTDFSTGKHWINVYATNAEGESGKTGAYFFTDISTPHVSVDTLSNTDINLNSARQNGLAFTGTGDAGDGLTLTLGTQTWQTLVGFDGTWRVDITPQQAQQLQLGNYTLKASVTDPAKNVGTETQDITFYNGAVTPAAAVDSVSADDAAAAAAATAGQAIPAAQPEADSSGVLLAATAVPHPTINTPFGDGWLNRSEKLDGQALVGTTGAIGSGQTVTVNINGVDYQAAVTNDGNWRLDLNTETLLHSEFNTGKRWITVTASNAEGETGSTQAYFFTDVSTPQTAIDTPADGTHINLNQIAENYLFTGTGDAGDALTLTLGALTWHTTVGFDGTWQAALTPQQAQQLTAGDYTLQATISDMAKNVGSSSLALDFYSGSTSPTVTINSLSDDNRVNLNILTDDYAIRGTGEVGARVTVSIGSLALGSVIVGQNGEWTTWLYENDAKQLTAGNTTILASVQDSAGHEHSASLSVELYAADVQPTLTMDTVEINDIVDYANYQNDVQLHGDSWGLHTDTEVTITLADKTYTGYVYANHWMATIPSADIEATADGYYNLKVSVESAGGNASASRDVLLLSHFHSSDPVLTFNALTPEDVVYHDDNAYYLISGTVTEPLPVDKLSFYGGELLNYYDINVAADGTFTSEVPVSEYTSISSTPGFYVSYQDAAGHWYETRDSVTLPDAPATVETADQSTFSLLAEANPLDDVSHASATDAHESSAAAVTESGATGGEPAVASHVESVAPTAGTEGNDTFTLSTLNLLSNLNGGAGHDTLVLNGAHEALDFASLGLKIGSVETIDLGTSGSNSLTLGQQDLLALTDNASEALTIKGADGSAVTLSTAEGGVWNEAGMQTIAGQQFDLYHNSSASHEGTLADVLIQHNLQVQTA